MESSNEIARIRKAKGVSQQELANRIGATLSMIGKLERGERKLTSDWLDRIAVALQTFPKSLLRDENDPTPIADIFSDGSAPFFGSLDIYAGRTSAQIDVSSFRGSSSPKLASASVVDKPVNVSLPVGTTFVFSLNDMRDRHPKTGVLSIINICRSHAPDVRLGVLLQGSAPNTYHVLTIAGEMQTDVAIHWALKIMDIRLP